MICPVCQCSSECKETRYQEDGRMRRYWCVSGHKFKTIEVLDVVYTDEGTKAAQSAQAKRASAARRISGAKT